MATDWVCPEAQSPASGMAKSESVAAMLIKSPSRFALRVRKARYRIKAVSGITSPKPVRRDMLTGRKRFGERFIKIRLKSAVEIPKKITCQSEVFIL